MLELKRYRIHYGRNGTAVIEAYSESEAKEHARKAVKGLRISKVEEIPSACAGAERGRPCEEPTDSEKRRSL